MIANNSKSAVATTDNRSVRIKWPIGAIVLLLIASAARAQTTLTAYLPEVDSYLRLSSNLRLVSDAEGYMEDGELNHAQIGPGLQFNFRLFEELKQITIFDLDVQIHFLWPKPTRSTTDQDRA